MKYGNLFTQWLKSKKEITDSSLFIRLLERAIQLKDKTNILALYEANLVEWDDEPKAVVNHYDRLVSVANAIVYDY